MSTTPPAEPGSTQQSELRTAVQGQSRKKRNIIIGIAAAAVALIGIAAGVTAINNTNQDADSAASGSTESSDRLSVSIITAEDDSWYDTLTEVAAEGGLDINWTQVDDWVLPNTEVAAGSIDANAFQHLLYLSAFNTEQNAQLTPVFSTMIVQWGIFSDKYNDISEIPDGAAIGIPDDVSNAARALHLAEAAGLITLDADAGNFPTTDNISENPKNISFTEISALSIATSYDDPGLAGVIIGTSYFDPAQGITSADALVLDDPLAEENLPYVNVVAVDAKNTDNDAWAILELAYADPRVEAAVAADFNDTVVLVQVPVATLHEKLAELETAAREGK